MSHAGAGAPLVSAPRTVEHAGHGVHTDGPPRDARPLCSQAGYYADAMSRRYRKHCGGPLPLPDGPPHDRRPIRKGPRSRLIRAETMPESISPGVLTIRQRSLIVRSVPSDGRRAERRTKRRSGLLFCSQSSATITFDLTGARFLSGTDSEEAFGTRLHLAGCLPSRASFAMIPGRTLFIATEPLAH